MHISVVLAALFLSASFVGAQCPPKFDLVPQDDKCICQSQHSSKIVPPNHNCSIRLSPDGICLAICHSHSPRPVKRQQLILNDDGSIANCPPKMISCPIDAAMDMGYECILPQEDLGNCGGCVSLGQGVSCDRVVGVRNTECSRGRCINHSCRSDWILDKRSNNCIPRLRHAF